MPLRTVTLCDPENGKENPGPRRLWAYGYTDIAKLAGVPITRVRSDVCCGKFDPAEFQSVLEYVLMKRGPAGARTNTKRARVLVLPTNPRKGGPRSRSGV